MRKEPNYKTIKIVITMAVVFSMFIFSSGRDNSQIYADTATTDITVGDALEQEETQPSDEVKDIVEEKPSEEREDESNDQETEITDGETTVSEEEDSSTVEEESSENKVDEESEKPKEEIVEEDKDKKKDELEPELFAAGEITVKTFAELKKAIESSDEKNYHTIHLGADITADGIINVKINKDLVVDGKDPSTGVIHTIKQKNFALNSILFSIEHNSNRFIVQNIKVDAEEETTFLSGHGKGDVHLKNFSYEGTYLAVLFGSNLTIEDANLYIKWSSKVEHPFAGLAHRIEIKGRNKIYSDTQSKSIFDFSDSLVFKNGSETVFESVDAIVNNDYNNSNITVEENAKIVYNQIENPIGQKSKYILGGFIINIFGQIEINLVENESVIYATEHLNINNGEVKIKADKLTGREIILSEFSIGLENANLDIEVGENEGIVVKAIHALYVTHSNIKINTGTSGIVSYGDTVLESEIADVSIYESHVSIDTGTTNYTTILKASSEINITTMLDVDSSFSVVNRSLGTPSFAISKRINMDNQQINLWNNIVDRNTMPQNNRLGADKIYRKNDYKDFIGITFSSNGSTVSGRTIVSHSDVDSLNTFNPNGYRIVSIGNMFIEGTNQYEDSTKLQVKTNPNTLVEVASIPPVSAWSDANGVIDRHMDTDIDNGVHDLKAFGNYVYNETKVTYDVDGELEIIKVPGDLDFGTVELTYGPKTYNRKTTEQIHIRDGRKTKTGWQLGVYLETELQIPNNPSTKIKDSVVYSDATHNNVAVPTSKYEPLIIAEKSGSNYAKDYKEEWAVDSGVLIDIQSYANVLVDQGYEAKLVWVLIEK